VTYGLSNHAISAELESHSLLQFFSNAIFLYNCAAVDTIPVT